MFSAHHTAISVTDIKRSILFYENIGFSVVMQWQAEDKSLKIVHMKLKGMLLELFCYASPKGDSVQNQTLEMGLKKIGVKHFGLRVDDIEVARRQLIEVGLIDDSVAVTKGRTGIEYFFIRDPDGLFVEIVQDDRSL